MEYDQGKQKKVRDKSKASTNDNLNFQEAFENKGNKNYKNKSANPKSKGFGGKGGKAFKKGGFRDAKTFKKGGFKDKKDSKFRGNSGGKKSHKIY